MAATTTKEKKATKRLSATDAAAIVLASTGKPMNCPGLIAEMAARKLWRSPGGKTPASTLYTALCAEIDSTSGRSRVSRFKRAGPGLFALA